MRIVVQMDQSDVKEFRKRLRELREIGYNQKEFENQVSYMLRDVMNIVLMDECQNYI